MHTKKKKNLSDRENRFFKRNADKMLSDFLIVKDEESAKLKARCAEVVEVNKRHNQILECSRAAHAAARKADAYAAKLADRQAGRQAAAIKNVYELLALRLHLLERLVLRKSLDKPPLVGYRLPDQSWAQYKVMGELVYKLRQAGDARLGSLEDIMYTYEFAQEERDRSVEKWIDGVAIPHPTTPDNDASTNDSGSEGFEIVSVRGRPNCKLEDVVYPTPTSSI